MDLDEGLSDANTLYSSVYSDEAGFYNYGKVLPDHSILFPGRVVLKSVGLNWILVYSGLVFIFSLLIIDWIWESTKSYQNLTASRTRLVCANKTTHLCSCYFGKLWAPGNVRGSLAITVSKFCPSNKMALCCRHYLNFILLSVWFCI